MKLIHTIKKEDVNKNSLVIIKTGCPYCKTEDRKERIFLSGFMGYILPIDVGKKIYEMKSGCYKVENDEQLKARQAKL